MTQQIINVGSGPSAGDGDPLRTAFIEINSNFTELYGTINGQAVTYSNVSGVTTSLGRGATFDVTKYVNSYSFVINRSGNGYSVGNTITIYGNLIGGAYSTQDVTVTVATLGNVTLGNIATFAFSGIPAQPVTSVAGRTGGVILTINDIVGLSAAYASQANIVTANTLTREYVDGQILAANAGVTAANLGMKGYVDQGNTIQTALITSQSAAIIAANLGMKGYVDSVATLSIYSNVNAKAYTESMGFQNFGNVNVAAYVTTANSAILGYIDLANTIQSGQVGAANLAIIAANLGMKGYVDSVAGGGSNYSNVNVKAYTETMGFQNFSNVNVAAYLTSQGVTGGSYSNVNATSLITSLGLSNYSNVNVKAYTETMGYQNFGNVNVAALITTNGLTNYSNVNTKAYAETMGFQNFGNVNVAAYVTTANSAILGYIDQANIIQSAQVNAANLAITAANVGLKGYVDQANTIQSAQVNAANLAITAANLGMKGYVDSVASQSIYGNGNVKSYLTQFDGNIVPSANVTFSLGNVTNRWKDLYLSGNTIFLGDATITTEGSRLVTTGVAISPPTGAVGFANVYYESPTDFAQIRSRYVNTNLGYTANLKSWTTAPIIWDSLRSAKIYHASLEFPDFDPLDTVGGRYANAVCTLDTTGNIASLTITDGGVGYDSYYPYYATDPTGYVYNHIGASYEGAPQGIGFRRIGLVPTTASDMGNVSYLITIGDGGSGDIVRGPAAPTVGSNTYTWTGNSGSTFSITINWTANTSTSWSYTPALPALTSAQEWQDWLLDYQAAYAGPTNDPLYPNYSAEAYLRIEARPSILIYDITNAIWFVNRYENQWGDAISDNYFRVELGGHALGYATLESGYSVPVYWSRGLSAESGISSGGDMTVAGDLRVTGDLYVSPDSIYLGALQLSSSSGNLVVHGNVTANNVTTTGNVSANYFVGNGALLTGIVAGGSSYSNVQVATYLPTYSGNIANVRLGTSGVLTFADGTTQTTAASGGGSSYGNANVTAYTVSMGFTNFSNVNVAALITTNGLTNYSNVNVKAYAETMGYQNFGNVNVAAYVTTANSAIIGYIDRGNTIVTAGITTANVGMKGYVDAGVIWSISASGTADYVFSGPGIVAGNTNDPVLYLYKGLTYTFINTTGGSHPFAIRVSNGGADYTSGVSGSQTGTQVFTVPMDAPSTLYYQCTIHGGMGNTIYIGSIDNNYSNVNVKAYTESMGFQNYSNVNVAALITTNGLTNYSNVNVIAYLAGNITVGNIAGSVNGFSIGYRDVPQITVANLTLIASDAGKHYYGANTNPTTITIPLNSSVAFGNGTAISIVNQGTGNITVANAAGVSLYLAGNSTAGSRTLTSYGMATLIKVQVNTWFINGTGVV